MVRTRRDLEIILKLHWYRIPTRGLSAPRGRYLAPYLTRGCGSSGGGITFYAAIIGIDRLRRRQLLPEEGNHPRAGEWYWRLRLGPIHYLPHRIENLCRRRLTFAYTHRALLDQAREIGELFSIPPLELAMQNILKESGVVFSPQFTIMGKKKCRYRLDFSVSCRRGRLAIECDHGKWHQQPRQQARDKIRDRYLRRQGWMILHFSEGDILAYPDKTRRLILSRIEELGGVFLE